MYNTYNFSACYFTLLSFSDLVPVSNDKSVMYLLARTLPQCIGTYSQRLRV
jgi:hypothetical protein